MGHWTRKELKFDRIMAKNPTKILILFHTWQFNEVCFNEVQTPQGSVIYNWRYNVHSPTWLELVSAVLANM